MYIRANKNARRVCRMKFVTYSNSGTESIPYVLVSLLNESGEHCYKIAFGVEPPSPRNFIFGVIVSEVQPHARMRVTICYELHEHFPLLPDSQAFRRLQKQMTGILEVEVTLLPFTQFDRSIAKYDSLYSVFKIDMHAAMFRHEEANLLDEKMHVILDRWNTSDFGMTVSPPVTLECATSVGGEGVWSVFFGNIPNVYWYHDYVFCAIGEMSQPGYSLSNVVDARLKLLHKNAGDEDTPGKIALLEVLELAYKCTYGP
jgi:hypothetical protein